MPEPRRTPSGAARRPQAARSGGGAGGTGAGGARRTPRPTARSGTSKSATTARPRQRPARKPARPSPGQKARAPSQAKPRPARQGPARPRPAGTAARRRPTTRLPAAPKTPAAKVIVWILRRWWLWAACALAVGAVVAFATFIGNVPLPQALPAAQSSTVYAADDSILALYHGTEDRVIVPLGLISPNLQRAVIAAEDRTFYSESGVSLRGILRALWVDLTGGSIAQGGSTITQQYVRNAYAGVGKQRTILRKLKEALLAIKFERRFSKSKILEDYLNTVYFGRGAYGAEAAARAYFNVPAMNLTVPEAAYLAGIIRSPESYQPDTNPQGANQIRNVVLGDMVETHQLIQADADAAKAQNLAFQSGGSATAARGAYFVEYVRRQLKDVYHLSDQQILSGGLRITTTLDPRLQDAAEAAVSSTLNRPDDPQAALVAMDVNGSIRAMVGGRDTTSLQAAQGFNFAYQTSGTGGGRQAGSAFKPFTLATFVEGGYSIQSVFQAPMAVQVNSRQCQNLDGSNWVVNNFKNEAFPDLTVTEATAQSVNTVYAQIIDRLGPRSVAQEAERVGGWASLPRVCSLALGTAGVTPLEMARAYATFATRGQRPVPLAITKVVTTSGQVLVDQAPRGEHVLDANVADTVTSVLTGVLDHGTAAGKGIGRPAAGKTGTTDKLTDAWFVGYTPQLSTAVWMGYTTDPKTGQTPAMTNVHGIQISGGTLPATIWQKFMKSAVAPIPVANFNAPTVSGRLVGPAGAPCQNGMLPTPDDPCLPAGAPCPTVSPSPSPAVPSPTPSKGAVASPTSPTSPPSTAKPGTPAASPSPSAAAVAAPQPCPSPSEALPSDIVIPSPSPSPGASPSVSPSSAPGGKGGH